MQLIVVAKAFWSDIGEANAARQVTTELVRLGVDLVAVVCADHYAKGCHQLAAKKTLIPINAEQGVLSKPPIDYYYLSARAAKALKLLRKDIGADCVIHCHNLFPSALWNCEGSHIEAKFFTTVHGMVDGEVARFRSEMPVHPRELLYRLGYLSTFYTSHYLLKRTHGQIIALSPKDLSEIARLGLQKSRIHLIQNGVDTGFFKPYDKIQARKKLGLPLDKSIVLTVNEIQPRKGLHLLIKAASVILKSVPDSHFVIVGRVPSNGKWYMGYLLKLLWKLDLCKHFSFTGFVPREQLPLYLSAADLFALPSYCEGAPLVIPGAMACGRLVVATRSAEAGYLPQHLVVENGNYSELAGKIAYYLSDLKRCRLIGNELRLKALREFTWKKIAEKTYDLYRKSP